MQNESQQPLQLLMTKIETREIIEAISDSIGDDDFGKLVELSLFCDPFNGVLDRRLFCPLKEGVFPDSHYYEYIFIISEDIDLFSEEINTLSLPLVFYITALYLHCERNHDWNLFLSGHILAIFLSKIIFEEQIHSEFARFLYIYVESLYGYESFSTEELLDFEIHDEILVLAMHYYARIIDRPRSSLSTLEFGKKIETFLKKAREEDKNPAWGADIEALLLKIKDTLINPRI